MSVCDYNQKLHPSPFTIQALRSEKEKHLSRGHITPAEYDEITGRSYDKPFTNVSVDLERECHLNRCFYFGFKDSISKN